MDVTFAGSWATLYTVGAKWSAQPTLPHRPRLLLLLLLLLDELVGEGVGVPDDELDEEGAPGFVELAYPWGGVLPLGEW